MSFWDNVDMSTPVAPAHAATVFGNLINIFSDRTGNSVDSLTDTTAPPAEPTATSDETTSPVGADTPISQGFGATNDHEQGHPGIDFAVPVGSPILAATGGTVTHAGDDDPSGYGSWVEITAPNGVVTRYGHLSGIEAKQGDKVTPGQRIGMSGGAAGAPGAGNSTGAHLHFEVHDPSGAIVDPTGFLAGGVKVVGAAPSTAAPAPASTPIALDPTVTDPINQLGDTATAKKATSEQGVAANGSKGDSDPAAIDTFLAATRQHESGGDYTIRNTSGLSNASGAYQFIGTTWGGYGGYTSAAEAPPAVQDAKAREMASQLFAKYHSWRLVAIAWYGGPGIADQVAAGKDPGAPDQQGGYLAYGDTIQKMMGGSDG